MLWSGYSIPFVLPPPLSRVSVPIDGYTPSSTKGVARQVEISLCFDREWSSQALSSLSGVLQPCVCGDEGFELMEAHYRPLHLEQIHSSVSVQMETNLSVLNAILRDDWMFSIDLKDAYLQVPFHLERRKSGNTFGLWHSARFPNSRSYVSASPRPPRCLPGSWLLFRSFCTI